VQVPRGSQSVKRFERSEAMERPERLERFGPCGGFPVQLEVEVREVWKPVSHGFAHMDRYNLRGRIKKERLALNYGEALTRAERDIKQNWSHYRERFLRGEWP
jgi:hypothetical protein